MKNTMAMVLAAAVGTGAWAKGVSGPVVTVCMDQIAANTVSYMAQGEASEIFSEVGVNIAWRSGRACQAGDVIHIHLSTQTPETLKPGAAAYALPYQGIYIEVFYDRITETVCARTLPHLLAHVLVHEITHILQGVARHSETGIMKAHWTADEYRQMGCRHLPFTPEDVELIQMGLQSRAERLQAQSVAPSASQSR
jgi:hypothetical protein